MSPGTLFFFILGIIAFHNDWLRRFPSKQAYTWFAVGIILAFVLIILNATGYFDSVFGHGGSSLAYTLWETFYCCGISIGLIVLFRNKLEHSSKFLKTSAASSYAVYLFHIPVIVTLQYSLASLEITACTKFILVSVLGVLTTFAFSNQIRKIPFVKKVL